MPAVKPNQHILKIVPYVAGEAEVEGVSDPAKLSSNESPLGASPQALRAYLDAAATLERYPDGGASALRTALAEQHGASPEQIVCGTGSEQLIDILAQAYSGPGDEVIFGQYGFIIYHLATLASGATPVPVSEVDFTLDVDGLLEAVTDRTRIVFIANPNNPTGTHVSKEEVRRLRAGLPEQVLLVIDAAYCEYADVDDYGFGWELVNDDPGNTVVLRTFSKIYGLAALRVGWAYCPKEVAGVLHRVRGVFNVSHPAQVAAIAALADSEHTAKAKAHNQQWLPWLSDQISSLGLEVSPSLGNFVLIHFADPEQSQAADLSLRQGGIILRPVGGYGLPQCLRASVGLGHENERMVELLKDFSS